MHPAPHPRAQEENLTPRTGEGASSCVPSGPGPWHGAPRVQGNTQYVGQGSLGILSPASRSKNSARTSLQGTWTFIHSHVGGRIFQKAAPCPGTPGLRSSSHTLPAAQDAGKETEHAAETQQNVKCRPRGAALPAKPCGAPRPQGHLPAVQHGPWAGSAPSTTLSLLSGQTEAVKGEETRVCWNWFQETM